MPAFVTRAFDRWIEHQDDNLVREVGSTRAWIVSNVAVCALLPLLAYAPGAREYFGLQLVPALLSYLPALLLGMLLERRLLFKNRISRAAYFWALAATTASHFFLASLIAWCTGRGAAAIASLFIVAAVYHGHVLRATLREPFLPIGSTLAIAAAAALDRHGRLVLFIFAGTVAVTVQLLLGINARRWWLANRRHEQLRAALTANILDDQAREMNRLSDTLVDVLGRSHDINNTLMALRLSADALTLEAERGRSDGIARILSDLRAGVERLAHVAGDIKTAGRPEGGELLPEIVEVTAVLDETVQSVMMRFAGVRHSIVVDRAHALKCAIRGGIVTLRRITENLLVNAYEGNGRRGATHVEIKVSRDPSGGRLLIVFTDDGPGFSSDQLARGIEVFVTNKPQGSGLGLFTCERLVRASDGHLERANAPGGGAQLTVMLPLVRGQ